MKNQKKPNKNGLIWPQTVPSEVIEPPSEGIPIFYARFHQPIPPSWHLEPVSEFRIGSIHDKYNVEKMTFLGDRLVWECRGETNFVPSANITYMRTQPKVGVK